MKKCNSEVMKELKKLQSSISNQLHYINDAARISYYEGEDVVRGFDLSEEMNKLYLLMEREAKLKSLLNYANATVKLMGYDEDITIADGLVKLAQFSRRKEILSHLQQRNKISKSYERARYQGDVDRVHIYECLYEPEEIELEYQHVLEEIAKLQVAIDRTNLNNIIEC